MKLLVSGGGTGGHVYPATSLIQYVKAVEPDSQFLYIGTENGLEKKIAEDAKIPFESIDIQGFRRSLSLENITTVKKFLVSLKESKKILKKFQPDLVVGTGGYVCAPVVYAAHQLGIPTLIHEQNSVPGIANKFLSKYTDKVAICFDEAASFFPEKKVVLTGNPRAQEVAEVSPSRILETYALDPEKKTVLIFGGSRGAYSMAKAVTEILEELNQRDYQTLIGTGNLYYKEMVTQSKGMHLTNVKIVPYIESMAQVLASIQLVVGRAGATSIAEITGVGLPSLLIPSPNVTNDHQTKNAQSLVKKGAAETLKDNELSGKLLLKKIDALMLDEEKLSTMSKASKSMGMPDAAERLYLLLKEIQ
ncbi:undecaprenyldiphospho-muramoylpentapeptide beta-N-acetylglucosaminyltransferase [Vagococcus elongatus]|uniref:UDP-N-acetylglucosamine--N-acetylmuramyl-(pentapeptide) pyrophosphoryl-undecaprenol N-acetylglucosamine transferase n=1 Tax=Vagococcus elongatus TaxID=180344 RepID=A0A430AYE0_9ENTE|nr:undecaprenyldiphospho-muramoylpentapeptide beta-N-acetylglucosaminyltransferase [Vagococcus elongatus]RSU13058.1 undecaprenyldiphospho-muramoylpentapeptide beta-N-acetylglucosaminyltransferase [Vagococcus elongatus]